MRRGSFVAASVVCFLAGLAACANIAGLESFEKGKCSGGGECDGGRLDGTVDAEQPDTSGDDATEDTSVMDAPSTDGGQDVVVVDAPADHEKSDGCGVPDTIENCGACGQACAGDKAGNAMGTTTCTNKSCDYSCLPGYGDCNADAAPNLDGCETKLNTTANCGSCGVGCNPVNATGANCGGLSCTYSCLPDASDCNVATAPNSDGCECATPACCGSGCQTTHTTGVGQNFFDCNPVPTYTAPEAHDACLALASSLGLSVCGQYGCFTDDAGFAIAPLTWCPEGKGRAPKSNCFAWEADAGMAGNVYGTTCSVDAGVFVGFKPPVATWK